jgi:hypothetical protein
MTDAERVAREAVERLFAEQAGRGFPGTPVVAVPDEVRAAAAFYDGLVEAGFDLCRATRQIEGPGGPLYLLAHGWELDRDGWLEVFGPDGQPLAAAQYAGTRVGWAAVAEVRESLRTGRPVAALAPALRWSKTPKGYVCGNGVYAVTRVGKKWRLTRRGEFIQDWGTAAEAQAHAAALALADPG